MTTPNMALTQPTVGGSTDTWGTTLNTDLDLIDAHDHTAGKGARIPTAGLNINADLPFGGFGLTGLKVLDFNAVAAISSGYLTSLFVSSADNELYWRTNGGVNVKLTSGSSLNASLLGGITGASYGTGGAEINYDGATKIYNHLQAANHRGKIDSADIRLFEATSGITNAVKLKSPSGLAASYDWTFPAALPGSTSLVQVDSAGQLTASNTVANALTLSALLTANGGVTLGSGQHVTVSGTGAYKRGTRVRHIAIYAGAPTGGSFDDTGWIPAAVGDKLFVPIRVDDGERITQVQVLLRADTTGSMTAALFRDRSTGDGNFSSTSIGSATTATNNNVELVTIGSLTETVASTNRDAYHVRISSTTTKGLFAYMVLVTTDVP